MDKSGPEHNVEYPSRSENESQGELMERVLGGLTWETASPFQIPVCVYVPGQLQPLL